MKTKNILSILMVFLILSTTASAVEIRGTVSDGVTPLIWNAQNFAGFYYDIDNGLSWETLTMAISGRTIAINGLEYKTVKIPVNFSYSTDKNKPIIGTQTTYDLVGWQAEKWVALNGKANKLVKLVAFYYIS